jgi:putative transposase
VKDAFLSAISEAFAKSELVREGEVNKRDHLRRLDSMYYQGDAIVHWSLTIRNRATGWLSELFHLRFRELLTHSCFRYEIACPIYCLMPDHFHMLWIGLSDSSDQLLAMKHFRKTTNDSLEKNGFELQDQGYDHVLCDDEREAEGFRGVFEYIARNPERANLLAQDSFASYPYTSCVIPGYPELVMFSVDFWDRLDRIISFLRTAGLIRTVSHQGGNVVNGGLKRNWPLNS